MSEPDRAPSGEDGTPDDEGDRPDEADGPITPSRPRARIPGRAWVKVLLAFVLATAAVTVVPRLADGSGGGPPLATLVGVGGLVAVATGAGMYVVIRRDLRLGTAIAVFAVGYNVLIVAVKFVLGPFGLYEVNKQEPLSEAFAPLGTTEGTVLTALVVGALYIGAYGLIYRVVRHRMADERMSGRGVKLVAIVVGTLVVGSVVSGGAMAIILFLLFGDALNYLWFVYTSSASALVAVALAIATILVSFVFGKASERERVVGDATLVASVFWLGLAFLALYHVLWVVYILILTTLWPLKVVTPK